MNLYEALIPSSLAYGLALFCLGYYIRLEATIQLSLRGSKNLTELTKQKQGLTTANNNKTKSRELQKQIEDIEYHSDVILRALAVTKERLNCLKKVIGCCLLGIVFMITSSFLLLFVPYSLNLYTAAIPFIIIGLLLLSASAAYAYREVTIAHGAELIIKKYVERREHLFLAQDDITVDLRDTSK